MFINFSTFKMLALAKVSLLEISMFTVQVEGGKEYQNKRDKTSTDKGIKWLLHCADFALLITLCSFLCEANISED